MVECVQTADVLEKIAAIRAGIEENNREIEPLTAAVEGKKAELYTTFGLKDIQYSKQLAPEIHRCERLVATKRAEISSIEQGLPDQLLDATKRTELPPTSEFVRILGELRETETQIAVAQSSEGKSEPNT